jgi:hypothetical protein
VVEAIRRRFGFALRRHALEEVFGVSTDILDGSYVDRANLDSLLKRSLRAHRHVAIHGGSLQGKSWLRRRMLADESRIVAPQCLPNMTAAGVIEETLGILGVAADVAITDENIVEGTLDWGTSAEATAMYMKAAAYVRGGLSRTERREIKRVPIGQGPASLAWVAAWIRAYQRRPVFEDFHHLSERELRRMAFVIKALGEMQVHCVVVGIWPDDNLLTFYNGELNGRIDDIHLAWSGADLKRVIDAGADALNIEFDAMLTAAMLASAFGSVGLLQRLLEAVCREAGIEQTLRRRKRLDSEKLFARARETVWQHNRGRFAEFTRAFTAAPDLGVGVDPGEDEAAKLRGALLRALVVDVDNDELIEGIGRDDLLRRVRPYRETLTPAELDQCLNEIHRRQQEMNVSPLILAYEPNAGRLFLADRAFLFYRHAGVPDWPWDD